MPARRLAVIALLLVASVARAQLPAGSYTIDPALPSGGGNFPTWASATAALAGGVTGAGGVVFTVASTSFAETVAFNGISGTSATNPVTFVAIGAPAIIDAGGAPDALSLNGANSYLNFENIEVRNFTRYGLFLNGSFTFAPGSPLTYFRSSFCSFKRVVADAPASSSFSLHPFHAEHSQDCTFEDCKFKGGGYALRTESIIRNRFSRCEFDGKGAALQVVYPFNQNDADNLWENCFIHSCGPTGKAMDIDVSSYGNMFWHNTILVTTSAQAVIMAGCCAWTRANSFRNNIVVNLGTGVAMMYGTVSSTAPGNTVLDFNDLDYNCYWAPNGSAIAMQSNPAFTPGTLASWQAFLAANPSAIPAGGGNSWDQNSIQADPLLASPTAPFDIHLQAGSPCIDSGTSNFAPGPWITNPSNFATNDDFEQNPRPATLRDIGADEVACLVPQYETNGPASSLDLNGVQASSCFPAVVLLNQNVFAVLNFASTKVGLGWEAVLATASLVPASAGGFVSGNGQILNINFAAPSVLFVNGGSFPSFATPFPGNFPLGFFTPPFPFIASIQMVNVDPSHPDGVSVSQGCELNVP